MNVYSGCSFASFVRVSLLGSVFFLVSATGPSFAQVTVGGPFTLTAADSSSVNDRIFRGKWMLVFFGYTSCPTVCPTTLSEIALALEALGNEAGKVQPIFITVDPERDTPEIVGAYAAAIDPRILGLSGTPDAIRAVSQAYGAYSERHRNGPGPDDYVIDHSVYIYVMDPNGAFVRGMDWDTPGAEIARTMQQFMAKAGG